MGRFMGAVGLAGAVMASVRKRVMRYRVRRQMRRRVPEVPIWI